MRAKIQKIIAALMAMAMLMSFAACGGNDDDKTTTAKATDAVQTEVVTDANGEEVTNDEGEVVTEAVEDESTEEADDKSTEKEDDTTKKDDKKTTKKDDKSTTKKDDKTTTKKDDKTTTKKDDKTTTAKKDDMPESKKEILDYYKKAVNKVNDSKAGFTKTRSSKADKFNVPGALSAFKGMIEKFMGIGSSNKYEVTVAKGTFGGKIKADASGKDQRYYYLAPVKLSESDIKDADCKKEGDNYVITLKLKDGQSAAGKGVTTVNKSSIDKCGLCVGDRDIDIFDHKTAEIMCSAMDSFDNKNVNEKTSNCKVVAKINASTGKMVSVKVTFDLDCSFKVKFLGSHNVEAVGTTTVEYKSFKW